MIKLTLYPKTKRVGKTTSPIVITEKLDGANLGLFKRDGKLFVAQRNWIYEWSDTCDSQPMYKGLFGWITENGQEICDSLQEGACIFGEWLGMGNIPYPDFKRFQQFAKANVNQKNELTNLYYDTELFRWSFKEGHVPDCIETVPIVGTVNGVPSIKDLGVIYKLYVEREGRNVEGLIVIVNNTVTKYVRYKDGIPSMHRGK